MKFKTGDKVIVREDSSYHNQREFGVGVITEIDKRADILPIEVRFETHSGYSYEEEDLEFVEINWKDRLTPDQWNGARFAIVQKRKLYKHFKYSEYMKKTTTTIKN